MWRAELALVAFVLAGCATPEPESFRPRGVDVYVEGGQSNYYRDGRGDDWRVGASVHFDITNGDEYVVEEEE